MDRRTFLEGMTALPLGGAVGGTGEGTTTIRDTATVATGEGSLYLDGEDGSVADGEFPLT